MIIAVDFDKTLNITHDPYPELGMPNKSLFEYLIEKQDAGSTIILWTCRDGRNLLDAVDWCESFGLRFDYVNENVPWVIDKCGDSRKVFADLYIDDKSSKWCDKKFPKKQKRDSGTSTRAGTEVVIV